MEASQIATDLPRAIRHIEAGEGRAEILGRVRRLFLSIDKSRMGDLALGLQRAFRESNGSTAASYLYGYAARAAMHDARSWHRDARGQFEPTSALLEWLDDHTADAEIRDSDNLYIPIVRGLRDYIAGDIRAAWQALSDVGRAKSLRATVLNDDMAGAVAVARPFPDLATLHANRGRYFTRGIEMVQVPRAERRLTIVVAVNDLYAEAFVPHWIESVSGTTPGSIGLHIHLMAKPSQVALLLDLFARTAPTFAPRLSVSVDHTEVRDRAYYTCGRFLVGRALLDVFGTPLLMSDADLHLGESGGFRENGADWLSGSRPIEAVFNTPPGLGYLPWRRMSASLLALPNSDLSREFLDSVSDAIEYFWGVEADSRWWIDQFALETARQAFLESGMSEGFATMLPNGVRRSFRTEANYKSDRLSGVPKVRALLNKGFNLSRALEAIKEGAA